MFSTSIIRPPPVSTLFTYTTLFRSVVAWRGSSRGRRHRARRTEKRAPRRPDRLDRKSTRLNSSHLVISYAVFCVKKKNLGRRGPAVQERKLRQQRQQLRYA